MPSSSTDWFTAAPPAATAAATAPPAPGLLMTAAELAAELRTSVKTIRRMAAAGKLPRPVKIGRGVRWVRSTVIAWLAAGCPDRAEWEAFQAPVATSNTRRA